jgi:hypothetical protein
MLYLKLWSLADCILMLESHRATLQEFVFATCTNPFAGNQYFAQGHFAQ